MVKRARTAQLDIGDIFAELSARLIGNNSDFFVGSEENVTFLLDLVNRTVEKGESNSLLVLGPRGVGKSALVRHVLSLASKGKTWKENVVLVQLNGSIHIDDKIALKEMTRQLELENVVGDKIFGSFADHLSFLLTSLKTGDKTSKPIIFVLEEFDLFCSHKNQTLLYNLFDTAQSRAVPICVIGVSCQIDVTVLLEKRVSSRFSHRHLNLMPIEKFSDYYALISQLMTVTRPSSSKLSLLTGQWNEGVSDFWRQPSVKRYVEESVFAFDKSVGYVKQILYLMTAKMLETGTAELSLGLLTEAREQSSFSHASDSIELTISDLSIIEICLLIAVHHISDIYDHEPFNFEMVKREFVKFKRRRFSSLPEEESVVFKCWENLLALEVILPKVGDRVSGQQLEYILNTSHLPPAVLKRAVEIYPNCPTEVVQWMSSSVHVGGV